MTAAEGKARLPFSWLNRTSSIPGIILVFLFEYCGSFPDLRFIIQDLPEVVVLAKANIDSQLPAAQVEGQVLAETQDFFTPQTRKGDGYTYLFRYVL